ncbi:hypothetical protein CLF_105238, partial [Clonorchis sinensis]
LFEARKIISTTNGCDSAHRYLKRRIMMNARIDRERWWTVKARDMEKDCAAGVADNLVSRSEEGQIRFTLWDDYMYSRIESSDAISNDEKNVTD